MKDDEYAASYGNLAVHKTMLTDRPRMEAYFKSIIFNKEYFDDSVVMDIGTGTGLLAMWVGMYTEARRVIAVEQNRELADLASKLVARNGLADRVEVKHCKVEDFREVEDHSVDIILSEWMGHYLLHEGFLDSVVYARNKFLRKGPKVRNPNLEIWRSKNCQGLLFPSEATIYGSVTYLSPLEADGGWDESLFFGLDLAPLATARNMVDAESGTMCISQMGEPQIRYLSRRPDNEVVVAKLDMASIECSSLNDLSCQRTVTFTREAPANCFALSFTCTFPSKPTAESKSASDVKGHTTRETATARETTTARETATARETTTTGKATTSRPSLLTRSGVVSDAHIILDTRPGMPKTHWMQTLIMFDTLPVHPCLQLVFNVQLMREKKTDRSYVVGFEVTDVLEANAEVIQEAC
ncbi:putative arginine N-methyltransferase [Gregarina niphandrodes]|uniref:Arginine N-methyltransferase n=1 Tax=Gregarina niphandrodes TaxID=110365 RepID=A0A023BA60_GRENI|nr:putative arginine N-methyltransferase [Gregarina niphandrodes]EZG77894.1 putative arginine N-methyltransferase [Gregarina niphandrodes]|eukprot:XP_011129471.1 putative arginine N-methyltransferase [Gregarina niphandrodes]